MCLHGGIVRFLERQRGPSRCRSDLETGSGPLTLKRALTLKRVLTLKSDVTLRTGRRAAAVTLKAIHRPAWILTLTLNPKSAEVRRAARRPPNLDLDLERFKVINATLVRTTELLVRGFPVGYGEQ